MRASSGHAFKGNVAVTIPTEAAHLGPEARYSRTKIGQESFAGSSDFVLAFRVQRIGLKKTAEGSHLRDVKDYTRGAKMLGDTAHTSAATTYGFTGREEDIIASSSTSKAAEGYTDNWKMVECHLGNVDEDGEPCNTLYLSEE